MAAADVRELILDEDGEIVRTPTVSSCGFDGAPSVAFVVEVPEGTSESQFAKGLLEKARRE